MTEQKNWTPAEVLEQIGQMETVFPNDSLYKVLEVDGFYPKEILLYILGCLERCWDTPEVDQPLQQPVLNRLGNILISLQNGVN